MPSVSTYLFSLDWTVTLFCWSKNISRNHKAYADKTLLYYKSISQFIYVFIYLFVCSHGCLFIYLFIYWITHTLTKRWNGKWEARVHLLYNSNFHCRIETYFLSLVSRKASNKFSCLTDLHRRCYLEHRKYS